MKFQDMEYKRLSVEEIGKEAKEYIQALKEAKNFQEADAAFVKYDGLQGHISTMSSLAQVRHSMIPSRITGIMRRRRLANSIRSGFRPSLPHHSVRTLRRSMGRSFSRTPSWN